MSDWIDVNEDDLNKSTEENDNRKQFSELGVGCHKVKIKQTYLLKTDSDSKMFYCVFEDADESTATLGECTFSGRSGKSTYTDKNKKERVLPGVVKVRQLFSIFDWDLKDLTPTAGKVEHFGQTVDAKIFKEFTGKKLIIGLQEVESDDPQYDNKMEVIQFMDMDGNYKGDDKLEATEKYLKKKPFKASKKRGGNTKESTGGGSTGSGEDSSNESW